MEFWTGEPHDVHHVVALHGECELTGEHIACGLHVPWNLEVITRDENRKLGAVVSRNLLGNDEIDPFSCKPDDGDDKAPF